MKKLLSFLLVTGIMFGYEVVNKEINDEDEEVITIICENGNEYTTEKVKSIEIINNKEISKILYIHNEKKYSSLDEFANDICNK